MPETVRIDNELNIIVVRSFGAVAFEHIAESIDKVKELHEKTGIDRVFVDTSEMTSSPTTSDMFELANMFPRDVRIAVWMSKEKTVYEDLQFGKTVALNRGVLINIFDSRDEALEWLKK